MAWTVQGRDYALRCSVRERRLVWQGRHLRWRPSWYWRPQLAVLINGVDDDNDEEDSQADHDWHCDLNILV